MNKVPSVDDFFNQYGGYTREEMLKTAKDFAVAHVQAALKEASQKACVNYEYDAATGNSEYSVAKSTIINAYPLNLIK